ncbi:17S U2 SnRNP complex component HTATSF1-like [Saccoglossus kowalevskii]|uniref:HIV Tat-specific factor 1 homolog n=1 Tax=Saccoglossus kowalevskii TaxID=10224 RepID=A0ABM0H153_SACKO|nr:PREDICTED: HIV Tat-specific factor 1 homolog [Saccoglossus kowalevskii]
MDTEFAHQLEQEQISAVKQETSDAYTYTDPNDGTVYEWDDGKQAWFPKIDDDFIAQYQANYGAHELVVGESKQSASNPTKVEQSPCFATTSDSKIMESQKAHKRKADEGWFEMEEKKNRNVYVTGLPYDTTLQEFQDLMSKCGIIMVDEQTNEPKIKLYLDEIGNLKGDGRCCYLKRESVDLALQILDGYDMRGHRITVELAQFQLKGRFDPSKKKKTKKKKKKKNSQEKLLEWRPERTKMMGESRKRHECVVILRHMFEPKEFEEDPMAINEIIDDLKAECGKFGEVKKVLIFDRHPDGVASVKFKEPEEADVCIAALNGRWFAKRQIIANTWDGQTDYQVEETSREREERLKGWQSFLEQDSKIQKLQ